MRLKCPISSLVWPETTHHSRLHRQQHLHYKPGKLPTTEVVGHYTPQRKFAENTGHQEKTRFYLQKGIFGVALPSTVPTEHYQLPVIS